MKDICSLLWRALLGLFRSRVSLHAEVLTLRQQLNVLQRKAPARPAFRSVDRLIFSVLYRAAPSVLDALTIVRPETVIRRHRAGFRKRFSDPTLMLARATRQTSRLFGGKVLHI